MLHQVSFMLAELLCICVCVYLCVCVMLVFHVGRYLETWLDPIIPWSKFEHEKNLPCGYKVQEFWV
jgi:hypothetical protein